MKPVIITTDSASDLGELVNTRNIPTVPLFVTLGDADYLDGVDIDGPRIFEYVKEHGILPKTAARGEQEFYDFFKRYTDEGNAVVHIAISSQISAMCNNAQIAANRLSDVYVVDGKSLSSGTGLLTLLAADLRDEGIDAKTIAERVSARADKVQASFVVDTMEYLYKGGRCGGLAAFAATALKIRPSIYLEDGKLKVGKKYMGAIKKTFLSYVEDTLKRFDKPDKRRIFITHSFCEPDSVDAVHERLISHGFEEANIITSTASATICSHCGKGTLGILYINE